MVRTVARKLEDIKTPLPIAVYIWFVLMSMQHIYPVVNVTSPTSVLSKPRNPDPSKRLDPTEFLIRS